MAFEIQTVVPSAARTTSGNSSAIPVHAGTLGIGLAVTAVSGTSPSMTVNIEWSYDGTNFAVGETTDGFAAITANKVTNRAVTVRAPYYRLAWTITGTTPSFTFSATAYTY
jgi:hypothetical protein